MSSDEDEELAELRRARASRLGAAGMTVVRNTVLQHPPLPPMPAARLELPLERPPCVLLPHMCCRARCAPGCCTTGGVLLVARTTTTKGRRWRRGWTRWRRTKGRTRCARTSLPALVRAAGWAGAVAPLQAKAQDCCPACRRSEGVRPRGGRECSCARRHGSGRPARTAAPRAPPSDRC